jgi:hypothetical protein
MTSYQEHRVRTAQLLELAHLLSRAITAFRRDQSELEHRSLTHQKLPAAMQIKIDCCSDFTGTKRIDGRQIAAASVALFLPRLR